MSLATEFLQACKEGFTNKNFGSVGGFLTDDFLMISPVTTRPKQGFLDLVSEGGNPAIIEDVEVIYENDDVAVVGEGEVVPAFLPDRFAVRVHGLEGHGVDNVRVLEGSVEPAQVHGGQEPAALDDRR